VDYLKLLRDVKLNYLKLSEQSISQALYFENSLFRIKQLAMFFASVFVIFLIKKFLDKTKFGGAQNSGRIVPECPPWLQV